MKPSSKSIVIDGVPAKELIQRMKDRNLIWWGDRMDPPITRTEICETLHAIVHEMPTGSVHNGLAKPDNSPKDTNPPQE